MRKGQKHYIVTIFYDVERSKKTSKNCSKTIYPKASYNFSGHGPPKTWKHHQPEWFWGGARPRVAKAGCRLHTHTNTHTHTHGEASPNFRYFTHWEETHCRMVWWPSRAPANLHEFVRATTDPELFGGLAWASPSCDTIPSKHWCQPC